MCGSTRSKLLLLLFGSAKSLLDFRFAMRPPDLYGSFVDWSSFSRIRPPPPLFLLRIVITSTVVMMTLVSNKGYALIATGSAQNATFLHRPPVVSHYRYRPNSFLNIRLPFKAFHHSATMNNTLSLSSSATSLIQQVSARSASTTTRISPLAAPLTLSSWTLLPSPNLFISSGSCYQDTEDRNSYICSGEQLEDVPLIPHSTVFRL